MIDDTAVQLVDSPEEALSPREARLERAAAVLRWGAIGNAVLAGAIVLLTLIGALQFLPNVAKTLHDLMLGRALTADDAALVTIVLTVLVNISLLLVLMIGVLAREVWAIAGVWLLAAINLAGLFLFGFTPGLLTLVAAVASGLIALRDVRAFRMNPVMLKELRGRMRGIRAFIVLTVYLGLMSGFTALLYLIYTPVNRASGSAAAGEVGRVLFMGIVGIEMLLIIFIAPSFTAGAITGERERQTFDLLRTTLLASPSFVIGKLESALGYVLLLLLAGIPLQSVAFLFGGVSELELILAFVILTVASITLGTVGIYFSAVTNRTLTASVRAYTATLVITFGAPLILNLVLDILSNAARILSPVVETILVYLDDLFISVNPIATALVTRQLLIDQKGIGFWTYTLSNGSTIQRVSPWVSFTIIYLVASTLLVVLAIRRMRKVEV
jgi:hypothetical protein